MWPRRIAELELGRRPNDKFATRNLRVARRRLSILRPMLSIGLAAGRGQASRLQGGWWIAATMAHALRRPLVSAPGRSGSTHHELPRVTSERHEFMTTRITKSRGRGRTPEPRARTTSRRPQPRRVRGGRPVRRGQSGSRLSAPMIVAAVVTLAILAGVGYAAGIFKGGTDVVDVVRHIVYTAPTGNAAAISLPASVKADLERVGLAREKVAVTRVDGDGSASTTVVDLTARTGDSPSDPPITVESRALPKINEKIAAIEATLNTPATSASQSLYTGLTRTEFTTVPTIIVSSGIDLADPVDFRSLAWSTPAAEIITKVKKAGVLPAMHGPVTFVTVPTTGAQPQLGQEEKDYRNDTWRDVLIAAGATSVTFVDPETVTPVAVGPAAAPVTTLGMPGTPIRPVTPPDDPASVTCSIPGSYFVVNTPTLIDADQTVKDLTGCVTRAVKARAQFKLDGWTSYEGPLTADGKPAEDSRANRTLSQQRVDAIATLLIVKFGVNPLAITQKVAHGNTDQPYSHDPRSEKNRTVRITYTVPSQVR